MKNLSIVFGMLLSFIPFSIQAKELPSDPAEKGLAIAKMADESDTGFKDFVVQIEMKLHNKQGNHSTRLMKTYTLEGVGDGDKSLIVFENPRDVKGSSVLTYTHKTRADDQWLYLPALKRVKRIASRNKSGPFMGSEFAYEDLASQEVEKYTYKFLREEKYNGADCYVIDRFPIDKYSGYTRITTWIHKERLTPEKAIYYDRKKSLLKTLSFVDYKQYINKFWRAGQFIMENHQKNRKTILKWNDYAFQKGLKEKLFSPNGMKRAK